MIVKESSKLNENIENINVVKNFELINEVNEMDSMLNFAIEFRKWKDNSLVLLSELVNRYKFVVGLGASTKGNMLLQALKVDEITMKYIIDNNQKKIGTWTSGSLIPIVDESYLENPHKAMFLLPYYYLDFFIELLEKSLQKKEFVELFVPLPYPKVIKVWGK
jgi:heptaprenylglyceryl phosphate synthase